jgi:hypothetical protein
MSGTGYNAGGPWRRYEEFTHAAFALSEAAAAAAAAEPLLLGQRAEAAALRAEVLALIGRRA